MSSKNKRKNKKAQAPTKEKTESTNGNVTNGIEKLTISDRACTGVLASQPQSRDIKIENFSLSLNGIELITDTLLELSFGRRYGLIGLNGSGKSTFLNALGHREIPIPEHINIYQLTNEVPASDRTALQVLMDEIESESARIGAEIEQLTLEDPDHERLPLLYSTLDDLDPDVAKARACEILHGLGFTKKMQEQKTRDFSGGWRMRIALAKALFVKPMLLLLDEPTNHLDLEACVWLEEYLKKFDRILVLVSHSQDFMNGVCTNIIHLQNKKLTYYGGNYDTYRKTRAELEENQMKRYNWEQDQIAHMKEYIARFGHGSAKLARQAQSKEKTLKKMEAAGLTEKVVQDKVVYFRFADCGKLPPPVVQFNKVSFSYPNGKEIYKDLDFGIDLDSRVALVGPNGVGKSTLLKLLVDNLNATSGIVRRHHHLRIAWYHQHLQEQLDLSMSPLQFMMKEFPEELEEERMRAAIGRYGVTGKAQVSPMKNLSDGQRSRVMFAWLAFKQPHLLLLDEPTNHLDIETIDALAYAINNFDGGMVLVSHDFRLIQQVAKEIWVCENKTVTPWKGDIQSYKEHLKKNMGLN